MDVSISCFQNDHLNIFITWILWCRKSHIVTYWIFLFATFRHGSCSRKAGHWRSWTRTSPAPGTPATRRCACSSGCCAARPSCLNLMYRLWTECVISCSEFEPDVSCVFKFYCNELNDQLCVDVSLLEFQFVMDVKCMCLPLELHVHMFEFEFWQNSVKNKAKCCKQLGKMLGKN